MEHLLIAVAAQDAADIPGSVVIECYGLPLDNRTVDEEADAGQSVIPSVGTLTLSPVTNDHVKASENAGAA